MVEDGGAPSMWRGFFVFGKMLGRLGVFVAKGDGLVCLLSSC